MKSTLLFIALSMTGAMISYHAVGAPDTPDKKKTSGKLSPKAQELKKKNARKKSKTELAAEAIAEARFFKLIRTKQIAPSFTRTRHNRYREGFDIKSRSDLTVDKSDANIFHGTTVIKGKKNGKTYKIKYKVQLDKKRVTLAFEKEKKYQSSWVFFQKLPSYEEPYRLPKNLPRIKDKK
ncbi:MAG: hypothetical protein P1V97_35725 [Planctomycetota bacterium]|nr:hypothetical protein [Planctomycetota bacterium]